MTTFALHDGVTLEPAASEATSSRPGTGTVRVTDTATGIDALVAAPDLPRFLLDNALARPPRRSATPCPWGRARRTRAEPPGCRSACEATVLALVRAGGPLVLVSGLALSGGFVLLHAPPRWVAAAAFAPVLVLLVTIAHEAGHWVALRVLVDGRAGAILVDWRTCAVLHGDLAHPQDRWVAAAGPAAGLVAGIGSIAVTHFDPIGAWTSAVLVAVNLLGLLPVTADGQRVFRSRP
ncbi:hypothetical protein [Curtobacterium sp. MCBD17_032]|uniref:hypothetical protein n=1 Tax=Curtobacterium sp. MCBD17_032 TaxID=2175659 RepID=UPI000DA9E3DC|nr:hypothetical protein [Curtobacterium sp. MCBD17_032]PZE80221.1 hypothetical protein DEI91_14700 [Curtobacterium sp. MCBD17_032]